MKKTTFSVLICGCIVLAMFLLGLFLGRNLSGKKIEVSALNSQAATPNSTIQTPSSSAMAADDGKININTADLYTLTKLEGIGEVYAQRIIDYRTENGPFAKVEDIMKVEGIGAKRYEGIKNLITTGG
jgi:competence protein ComEA